MTLSSLFFTFLRIGAFTFGGGIVMIGVMERELRSTGTITNEEISDMIVLATAFPGPVAINLSFLAGKRFAGISGAAVSVLGTALPPYLTIILLSGVLLKYMGQPWLNSFFLGAACAVAIIVGRVVYSIAKISFAKGWREIVSFGVVVLLMLFFDLHPFFALGAGVAVRLLLGEEKTQ